MCSATQPPAPQSYTVCSTTDNQNVRRKLYRQDPLKGQYFASVVQDLNSGTANFNAAMGNLSALAAGELVRVYDFSAARTVVDVGGAHGVLLAAILKASPATRGIVFDLPHVIARAGDAIAAQGLSERCDLVSGDFFQAVPEGADLHLLKHIVHDWDDERATLLLRSCHRALAPNGKLLLVEMVVPADNRPSPAQSMDLNMLVVAGGRERTEEEYRQLLAGAGFRLERVIPTHSPFSVIEATRA
jgi:SAM-dependent methyltransferase